MTMIIILLNFSNDLVQKFFEKMSYHIDSLFSFSLYNQKMICLEHENCPIFVSAFTSKFGKQNVD